MLCLGLGPVVSTVGRITVVPLLDHRLALAVHVQNFLRNATGCRRFIVLINLLEHAHQHIHAFAQLSRPRDCVPVHLV